LNQPLLTHDPAFDLMLVLGLLQTCHVVMVVFETEQEAQSLAKLFRTAVTLQPSFVIFPQFFLFVFTITFISGISVESCSVISSEIPFSPNSESFSLPKIGIYELQHPIQSEIV
jgi:hypothetical protein